MEVPAQLSCTWQSGIGAQSIKQELKQICDPLEAILRRTASDQKDLKERLSQLEKENWELEATNRKLREELVQENAKIARDSQSVRAESNVETLPSGLQSMPVDNSFNQSMENVTVPGGLQTIFKANGRQLKHHDSNVHSVAMLPDSVCFATASWDAKVLLVDASTCKVTKRFPRDDVATVMGGLYCVAFSPATNVLACTSADHSAYVWNCATGDLVHTLKKHTNEVNGVSFHDQQRVLCTCSDDDSCIIWDYDRGQDLRTLKHESAVYSATFFSDKEYYCATACFDKITRVWDIRDTSTVVTFQDHEDDVIGIDYNQRKNLLATSSDDGLICIKDTRTWKPLQSMNTRDVCQENEVKRIAWSPCGRYLAAACSDNCVLVYDFIAQGQLAQRLDGHTDCVFDVAWGRNHKTNKKLLVSACHDGTSIVWEATSAEMS